jgi:hypothetical protein
MQLDGIAFLRPRQRLRSRPLAFPRSAYPSYQSEPAPNTMYSGRVRRSGCLAPALLHTLKQLTFDELLRPPMIDRPPLGRFNVSSLPSFPLPGARWEDTS